MKSQKKTNRNKFVRKKSFCVEYATNEINQLRGCRVTYPLRIYNSLRFPYEKRLLLILKPDYTFHYTFQRKVEITCQKGTRVGKQAFNRMNATIPVTFIL